jgi:hypothetical protein
VFNVPARPRGAQFSLQHLAVVVQLFYLGFPDQASVEGSAAIVEARRLALPVSLTFGASLLSHVGDNPALRECVDQLIAVTTKQGFPIWGATGTIYRGWAKVKSGEVMEGISLLRSGLTAYRFTGVAQGMPQYTALLADACAIAGQIAKL